MKQPRSVWHTIRSTMLAGLVVIAPFAITLFVLFTIVRWFFGLLSNLTEKINLFHGLHPALIFMLNLVVGLLLLALILWLAGELFENFAGQRFIEFWEEIIERIPIFGTLYRALKQVMSPGGRPFQKVVMIEYPRSGVYSIGFMTGTPDEAITTHSGTDFANIFIPNALNPTGGWLVIVPRAEVKELDMTVDEALAFIISGGMASRPPVENGRNTPPPPAPPSPPGN
ncbi:MAG: DUF502 domain-containing protein [bacterium]